MAESIPEEVQHALQQRVRDLMQMRIPTFPGAQPVSFERKHLSRLKEEDFLVSEKADGMRYLMFCTMDPEGMPATFLIDRRNNYQFVPRIFFPFREDPSMCHVDTLLDGELVVDTSASAASGKRFRFLIFDAIVMDGRSIAEKSLYKRLGYAKEHILVPFWKMVNARGAEFIATMPFSVEMKDVQLAYGLDKIFVQIAKLRHGNDGLIFTAVNAPYRPGTCDSMLKWKPPHLNSIDFKLTTNASASAKEGRKIFDLSLATTSSAASSATTVIYAQFEPTDETEFMALQPEGKIAECWWEKSAQKWRFMKFREDKDTPNHTKILPGLWGSIEDGVEQEILMDASFLKQIEVAWKDRKAREAEAARRIG